MGLYKEKNKAALEKDFENNKFLPKKGSCDYLNSVSPNILRGANTIPNVHKTLFNYELLKQKEASIKNRNDVIYQYLKTFSLFNKIKNVVF